MFVGNLFVLIASYQYNRKHMFSFDIFTSTIANIISFVGTTIMAPLPNPKPRNPEPQTFVYAPEPGVRRFAAYATARELREAHRDFNGFRL